MQEVIEFQSTLPRRERQLELEDIYDEIWISIHTPTKGATSHYPLPILNHLYFNPHSHEGSDFPRPVKSYERLNFNPHSHEGSDAVADAASSGMLSISIHTPTKGATDYVNLGQGVYEISIHTPTKGATQTHKANVRLR